MVIEPQALEAQALAPDLWFLLQMFPSTDSEGTGLLDTSPDLLTTKRWLPRPICHLRCRTKWTGINMAFWWLFFCPLLRHCHGKTQAVTQNQPVKMSLPVSFQGNKLLPFLPSIHRCILIGMYIFTYPWILYMLWDNNQRGEWNLCA